MMESLTSSWLFVFFEILSVIFILVLGLGLLTILVLYVVDVSQTKQTIRRNYPVIGRFR